MMTTGKMNGHVYMEEFNHFIISSWWLFALRALRFILYFRVSEKAGRVLLIYDMIIKKLTHFFFKRAQVGLS